MAVGEQPAICKLTVKGEYHRQTRSRVRRRRRINLPGRGEPAARLPCRGAWMCPYDIAVYERTCRAGTAGDSSAVGDGSRRADRLSPPAWARSDLTASG